ncbi:MAG TPA: tetratricopeptide repeat protein, partial [Planctomycetota bacterium]|nr:tetratricopeptide repeat protein [Planctomycetota bacterium]
IARINVQLVETGGGSQLWGERFDRPIAELFLLQDDIIRGISRVLEPRLVRETFERIEPRHCEYDAWQAYRRASGLVAIKGWRNDTFAEAAELLRRSVAIDPGFARAHALLSLVRGLGQRVGLVHDRQEAVAESLAAAERALALDTSDSTVLGFAGCALADVGHIDRGLAMLEQAVELDPSNAQAWAAIGAAHVLADRPREAIEPLRRGIRISPLDNRLAVWSSFLAIALLGTGDLDAALAETDVACRRDLRNHMPRVVRAAVLVAAGRADDAARALDEARRLRPELDDKDVECLVGRQLLAPMRQFGLV